MTLQNYPESVVLKLVQASALVLTLISPLLIMDHTGEGSLKIHGDFPEKYSSKSKQYGSQLDDDECCWYWACVKVWVRWPKVWPTPVHAQSCSFLRRYVEFNESFAESWKDLLFLLRFNCYLTTLCAYGWTATFSFILGVDQSKINRIQQFLFTTQDFFSRYLFC